MGTVSDGEIRDEELVLRRVVVGALGTNCWVVCGDGGGCIVVDPGDEAGRIRAAVGGLRVEAIVITHGHWDHMLAAGALAEEWSVTPLMHAVDRPLVESQSGVGSLRTAPLAAEATFPIGSQAMSVLHTPGHTPGSVCLRVGGHLLSGDTLFPGGPGATRGPAADFPTIMRSLREKLFVLPDDVQVHPGHGHSTRIGAERPHLDEWDRRGW